MPLPNGRQQTALEQFSINDTMDIRLCYRCGEEGHIENTATQMSIVISASHTHTTHQYAGHMQTLCGHILWLQVEGLPQHKEVDNKIGHKNQQKRQLQAT